MSRGLYMFKTKDRGDRVGYYNPIDNWFSGGGTYTYDTADSPLSASINSRCSLGMLWYESRGREVSYMLVPEEVFNNE